MVETNNLLNRFRGLSPTMVQVSQSKWASQKLAWCRSMMMIVTIMMLTMTMMRMVVVVSGYNQNGVVRDYPTDYSDPVSDHLALLALGYKEDLGSI